MFEQVRMRVDMCVCASSGWVDGWVRARMTRSLTHSPEVMMRAAANKWFRWTEANPTQHQIIIK